MCAAILEVPFSLLNRVPASRKQLVVATTAYSHESYVALSGSAGPMKWDVL